MSWTILISETLVKHPLSYEAIITQGIIGA